MAINSFVGPERMIQTEANVPSLSGGSLPNIDGLLGFATEQARNKAAWDRYMQSQQLAMQQKALKQGDQQAQMQRNAMQQNRADQEKARNMAMQERGRANRPRNTQKAQFVKMQGLGPNQVSGYVGARGGDPGAVFSGYYDQEQLAIPTGAVNTGQNAAQMQQMALAQQPAPRAMPEVEPSAEARFMDFKLGRNRF